MPEAKATSTGAFKHILQFVDAGRGRYGDLRDHLVIFVRGERGQGAGGYKLSYYHTADTQNKMRALQHLQKIVLVRDLLSTADSKLKTKKFNQGQAHNHLSGRVLNMLLYSRIQMQHSHRTRALLSNIEK